MTSSNKLTPNDEASPVRIALVTTELRPGGAERNLVALAKGLDREQFSPHVYSLAPAPPAGEDVLVAELQAAGIPVSFVGVQRSWQFFTAVRRLRELLNRQSPDLVQSFLFHANVVSAMACRKSDVPVVAGLRVAQRELLRQFVDRRLAHRFAAFVCVSHGVADLAKTAGRLPPDKVRVIPNGLDAQRFADVVPRDLTSLGASQGSRVVLFLGRLEKQKGVDVLLQAAGDFLPRMTETILLVVGEGPDKGKLQHQATSSGLSNRITFVPWQCDPLPLIAAADLVVIPSRWEGMSNVLLEAVALGTPVVATDVEGVRETLSPEAEAAIVPPNDPTALANGICKVLSDSTAAASLASANREHVWDTFSIEQTVAAYADLYSSLVLRGKSG